MWWAYELQYVTQSKVKLQLPPYVRNCKYTYWHSLHHHLALQYKIFVGLVSQFTNFQCHRSSYASLFWIIHWVHQSNWQKHFFFQYILESHFHVIDGCGAEVFHEFEWPETDLGDYTSSECPCSEYLDTLAGKALRYCDGDYTNGARWSQVVDTSACVALTSTTTRRLCQAAAVSYSYNDFIAPPLLIVSTCSCRCIMASYD